MIKSYVNKLKNWCIHMLGGYVASDISQLDYLVQLYPIKTFTAEIEVARQNKPSFELIAKDLYSEIAKQLKNSNIGKIEIIKIYSSNPLANKLRYKLDLNIITKRTS